MWTCRGNDLAKLGFEGLWRKAMRDLREIDFQPGMRAAGYQNRLYRYLVRLTANPAVAEDLFHETWLKVITRIHRHDERR